MVDRYHKGGYALPVPCGSECGYVCEKEEKCGELKDDMSVRRQKHNFIKSIRRPSGCAIARRSLRVPAAVNMEKISAVHIIGKP